MPSVVSRRVCEVHFLCGVAAPVAGMAVFSRRGVEVAAPVAGLAAQVAAPFRRSPLFVFWIGRSFLAKSAAEVRSLWHVASFAVVG